LALGLLLKENADSVSLMDEFQDVSLNNWLRRLLAGIVTAHLNLDENMIERIPAEKLEVI